jgi:hypothetical protein
MRVAINSVRLTILEVNGMKKRLMVFCVAALSVPVSALAGVNVNVNLGVPAPVVVASPPPVAVAPPPPTVVFSAPPLFLAPPRLGIYVGVDMPYDIVFADNFYYLNYHNAWYRSNHYNGPWAGVRQERLPLVVRRQGVEYIRTYRDREYRDYRRDHDHYHGRYFRPDQGGRPMFVDTRGPGRGPWQRPEHGPYGRDVRAEQRHDQRELKADQKREKHELKDAYKREKQERQEAYKRDMRDMKADHKQEQRQVNERYDRERDHGRPW